MKLRWNVTEIHCKLNDVFRMKEKKTNKNNFWLFFSSRIISCNVHAVSFGFGKSLKSEEEKTAI